jgi:NitT/TauT family transport system permease protein
LLLGTSLGVILGAAVARWQTARDAILPLAVAANAVPIIAFAPIMNNWFGVLNPLSKAAIAAVLVFFPIFINVVRGLTSVEPSALELMRSYAASDWVVMTRVRIPNALPYFLTGLKVSTVLALIGAIVGEYFGGASNVIGRIVVQSASALRWDVSWAAIILGSTAGIVLYLIIVAAERVLIPWHPSVRGDQAG